MKYLVVSTDPRIPGPIVNEDYVHMTGQEFVDAANSDDGLDVEPGSVIYYNIDSINEDIYNVLKNFPIEVKYYLFADQTVDLNFFIEEKVTRYRVQTEPKVDEVKEEQKEAVKEPVKQQVDSNDELSNSIAETNKSEIQAQHVSGIWTDLLKTNSNYNEKKTSGKPAKSYLFGSSKGGTGKTFTCLLSAYRYAKTHPNERIALADFDIIDGQVGIALWLDNKAPTLFNYYELYKNGRQEFNDLYSCHAVASSFSPNVDIYLAPPFDFPEVTNNNKFWENVFVHLLENYDVVFFDSGIDYLGKLPISRLYQTADKILITSNTSINSVKSVIKQLENIGGYQKNNIFKTTDNILSRTHIIFTRVSKNPEINKIVSEQIKQYGVNIAASFGNLDEQITRTQWYQKWEDWDTYPKVIEYLDGILA